MGASSSVWRIAVAFALLAYAVVEGMSALALGASPELYPTSAPGCSRYSVR